MRSLSVVVVLVVAVVRSSCLLINAHTHIPAICLLVICVFSSTTPGIRAWLVARWYDSLLSTALYTIQRTQVDDIYKYLAARVSNECYPNVA